MRIIGLILLTCLLTACGFRPAVIWSKLDGPVQVVSAEPYNDIERELNSLIQQSLASLDDTTQVAGNRRIELAPTITNTDVISVDSNGRPAEYFVQITQDVSFVIDDEEFQQQFTQEGEYVFDVRDILAYKQQLRQLEQRMSARMAQQIMFAFASRLQTSNGD